MTLVTPWKTIAEIKSQLNENLARITFMTRCQAARVRFQHQNIQIQLVTKHTPPKTPYRSPYPKHRDTHVDLIGVPALRWYNSMLLVRSIYGHGKRKCGELRLLLSFILYSSSCSHSIRLFRWLDLDICNNGNRILHGSKQKKLTVLVNPTLGTIRLIGEG
jgi:hypothetical protein